MFFLLQIKTSKLVWSLLLISFSTNVINISHFKRYHVASYLSERAKKAIWHSTLVTLVTCLLSWFFVHLLPTWLGLCPSTYLSPSQQCLWVLKTKVRMRVKPDAKRPKLTILDPLAPMKSLTPPLRVSKCYFGSKTSSGSSTQRPSETYFMRFVGLSPHHSPRLLRTMPVNRSRLRQCHKISVQQMLTWQKINFSE